MIRSSDSISFKFYGTMDLKWPWIRADRQIADGAQSYLIQMKSFLNPCFLIALGLLVGCTPVRTKTPVERLYELDPKGKIFISPVLKENPL